MEPGSNTVIGETTNKVNQTKLTRKILIFLSGIIALFLIISLVFVGLNYFNIIKLNSLSPIFSFLPHKTIVSKLVPSNTNANLKAKNPSKVAKVPTAMPTPVGKTFQVIISNISAENIQTKYLSLFDATKTKKSKDGSFDNSWVESSKGNTTFAAEIKMKSYSTNIYDYSIRVNSVADNLKLPLTKDSFGSFVQQFFSNPQFGAINCYNGSASSTCVSEKILDSKIKIKYKAVALPSVSNYVFILLCSVNPNSPSYDSNNYCLL